MSSLESVVQTYFDDKLDSDACNYIVDILSGDPNDEDAREAVMALIEGSVDDEELATNFFKALDLNNGNTTTKDESVKIRNEGAPLRKLSQSVTLKHHDVTSFASGLSAAEGLTAVSGEQESQVAAFYANMIDVSNKKAISERARRKERQVALRRQMEEEERQRAMQDAMDLLFLEEQESTLLHQGDRSNSNDNVRLENFSLPNLRGGGQDLLQDASLTLSSGRRYGLLGRNGCGKTTLMSFIATRQIKGAVPQSMSMLLVRQEVIGNDWTSVETVLKSDVKRCGLLQYIATIQEQLDKLEDGSKVQRDEEQSSKTQTSKSSRQKLRDRKKSKKRAANNTNRNALEEKLNRAHEMMAQLEEEEGSDAEPRARKLLAGLGFSPDMQDSETRNLSGGWRMRVALCCALFASPSLLLLDEPTNHLDLEAVLWLQNYLVNTFRGTLLVVSHDRHFLNSVVTDIVHFDGSALKVYRGDVDNFEAVRQEHRQRQIRQWEAQEAKRSHLEKYITLHAQAGENGVKAARQRKSKMKKLEKLGVMAQGQKYKASYDGDAQEVEEYKEEEETKLVFPNPGSFDGDIVRLEEVTFGYSSERILLRGVDLSINLKSRVALLGRNGCGKSTVIKLVVGALHASKGKAVIDGRAKIEYLAQHQLEQLDPDSTPIQTILERYPGDGGNNHILQLRRYLANFGLGGQVLPNQRIYTMSGGQKCRLCLACAMYRQPHLLILDEPTNHLDLETTHALIEAIRDYEGGVLLVSHDEHLLTSVCKDLYVLENGSLELLRGGISSGDAFQAYKKAVIQGRR